MKGQLHPSRCLSTPPLAKLPGLLHPPTLEALPQTRVFAAGREGETLCSFIVFFCSVTLCACADRMEGEREGGEGHG
jgi:hypothetical protein